MLLGNHLRLLTGLEIIHSNRSQRQTSTRYLRFRLDCPEIHMPWNTQSHCEQVCQQLGSHWESLRGFLELLPNTIRPYYSAPPLIMAKSTGQYQHMAVRGWPADWRLARGKGTAHRLYIRGREYPRSTDRGWVGGRRAPWRSGTVGSGFVYHAGFEFGFLGHSFNAGIIILLPI